MPSTTAIHDGASLTEPELAAWRGLLRAYAKLIKALDAQLVAAHGLSLSSYEVLVRLAGAPDDRMRMSDLADSVLLSRSGLTRLVDRLEEAGLLERIECDSDARGSLAALTAQGRAKLRDARTTHLAGVRERFLSRLEPDDLDRLATVWDRVLDG